MLTTTRRSGLALATAATLTATALLAPATADAASGLFCRASVSDSTPSQYSDVYVHVRTKPRVHVHTVAHYKTTNTAHNATANANGRATIKYHISDATPGYKVVVSVTVRGPVHTAHCATSFTPHK